MRLIFFQKQSFRTVISIWKVHYVYKKIQKGKSVPIETSK